MKMAYYSPLFAGLLLSGCALFTSDDERVVISGELKQWHKITLNHSGPYARESDTSPNPFMDYKMTAIFTHTETGAEYTVPGYFAADGNAAESSASEGAIWKAHFTPDLTGKWKYEIDFKGGTGVAIDVIPGEDLPEYDDAHGSFVVMKTDKSNRDFRGKGRLQYVGKHHLQFAGTKEYFLKAGADAPETMLGYEDFDGTVSMKPNKNWKLKTWGPHIKDWNAGDLTWKGTKGKGLVGAVNYLSSTGCNAISFLTYNAGGDGDNVWPNTSREDRYHFDCSKLEQWQKFFDYTQQKGMFLNFKLQETENDDLYGKSEPGKAHAMDQGKLGPERKLYLREIIARFGHELALNWNIGEENTQSTEEQQKMISYIKGIDPYNHPRVLHSYPNEFWHNKVYTPNLGPQGQLTGAAIQVDWKKVHQYTLRWVNDSATAGQPWVVANDEQGPANIGVPADFSYRNYQGKMGNGKKCYYTPADVRKKVLWGNIMAGGAGVEYYFGYQVPESDLFCEDWRSRHQSWEWANIALTFFRENKIPFWDMENANQLIGNGKNTNEKYAFVQSDKCYLIYLPDGMTSDLDLRNTNGDFTISWFNPRAGGVLQQGTKSLVSGGSFVTIGLPPQDLKEDWLAVVKKK